MRALGLARLGTGGGDGGVGDGGVACGGDGLLRLDDRIADGAVRALGLTVLRTCRFSGGVGDGGVVGFDDRIALSFRPLCGSGIAGGMERHRGGAAGESLVVYVRCTVQKSDIH